MNAKIAFLFRRPLVQTFAVLGFLLLGSGSARAGTPLICHPYAIGNAPSLPGSGGDWKGVNPAYDRSRLIGDTLALLAPETPLIVRMETLRRAAIYATAGMRGWGTKEGFKAEDRAQVAELLARLRERAAQAAGDAQALAWFDLGFLAETLRHTGVDASLDGYGIIVKALQLRGADPEMEFALALATSWPNRRNEHAGHLARARRGAQPGSLLALNLSSHFSGS